MLQQENKNKTLIVVTGPTGSGKTDLAIKLALHYGCHILSADSRQLYREIPIGTAAPTAEQLALVPHHFVGTLSLEDYYSAAQYEEDVLNLLPQLWETNDYVVMCGGSMMYVDAITKGIDDIPTITPEVREKAMAMYQEGGIELLRSTLLELDPVYYNQVDLNNHKRLVHAIEVIMQAGVPYSSLRTGRAKQRPFRIVKMSLNYDREVLFDRINRRVDAMVEAGLEQEARSVYHLRHLNSLNTVGYKEMFAYFDGEMDYDTAVARIGKNTRVYAKKQLTWYKRDADMHLLSPENAYEQAIALIEGETN